MFFVWLSEEPSDIIVIVWTLVIPVHHCQLYQDILVLTTYLINIRVTLPQHKLTSSDLVIGCYNSVRVLYCLVNSVSYYLIPFLVEVKKASSSGLPILAISFTKHTAESILNFMEKKHLNFI